MGKPESNANYEPLFLFIFMEISGCFVDRQISSLAENGISLRAMKTPSLIPETHSLHTAGPKELPGLGMQWVATLRPCSSMSRAESFQKAAREKRSKHK